MTTRPASGRPGETRSNLRHSMIDGVCWSVMVGLGESYFPALVLALALNETASGLIATLPPAIAAIAQLLSTRAIARIGSHRRWVLITATLQAVSLIPMAAGALMGAVPGWAVFAAVALYFSCGFAGAGAWSTWVGTLVPGPLRARFFGRRQRALQIGILVSFLAAGAVLHLGSGGRPLTEAAGESTLLLAFSGLLLLAGLARAGSVYHLIRQTEPSPMPLHHRRVGPKELWNRLAGGSGEHHGLHLLIFIFALQLASKVSEPFLTPYLVNDRGVEPMVLAMLLGAPMLGKALALTLLGPFAARFGARRLMLVAGLAVIPLGAMLAGSTAVPFILAVQLLSGAAWACYDLATFLLILEDVPEHERTSMMGYYFFGVWLCSALGSVVGAVVLRFHADEQGLFTHAGYMWVFVASSILRALVCATLLLPVVRARRSG
ncbi:MAG: MFS transporter [Phycisphaerales bacterium]